MDLLLPRSLARRAWFAPFWLHAWVLGVVLIATTFLVGPSARFSSDENAVQLQAHILNEGRGWTTPNPLSALDASHAGFFIKLSEPSPHGFAPYAKHPLYVILVQPFERASDSGGLALSLLGTLLAAVAAGKLGALFDERLLRPALWVTGLASPLFFDAQMFIAHSLASALCGWGTWFLLSPAPRLRVLRGAGALLLILGAVLLRSESFLFAVALAAVYMVTHLRQRDVIGVLTGVTLGLASIATLLFERNWVESLLDTSRAIPLAGAGLPTSIPTRLLASVWTLFGPARGIPEGIQYAATGALVVAGVGAFALRRGAMTVAARLFALAAVASLLGVFVSQPEPITGLIPAFPLMAVALVLFRREDFELGSVATMSATCGVFSLLVLATSYEVAGAAEWGGRFFAVALPLIVPVLLVPLARELPWSYKQGRSCIATLVALSLAFTILSGRVLSWQHSRHDSRADAMTRALDAVDPRSGPDLGDGDRRPIVLSLDHDAGRFGWKDFDRLRGLIVYEPTLASTIDHLAKIDASAVVVVADDLVLARAIVEGRRGWMITRTEQSLPDFGGALVVERTHVVPTSLAVLPPR